MIELLRFVATERRIACCKKPLLRFILYLNIFTFLYILEIIILYHDPCVTHLCSDAAAGPTLNELPVILGVVARQVSSASVSRRWWY